eukprot:760334-Hanusia_phi.AAC.1
MSENASTSEGTDWANDQLRLATMAFAESESARKLYLWSKSTLRARILCQFRNHRRRSGKLMNTGFRITASCWTRQQARTVKGMQHY